MAYCSKCGTELEHGSNFCPECGKRLEIIEEKFIHFPKQTRGKNPAANLKSNRGVFKFIILSIITLGIYALVVMSVISRDINTIARRYDGKKTTHFCVLFFLFSWLTLGIAPLVWYSKISNRIGRELKRRNIDYRLHAGHFWGWNILGCVIIVGPFIYLHKLFKGMNILAKDYNVDAL